MANSALVTRVVLKNYKSIAACDVRLGPLTILVGSNGSGKSNFLDALRFVSDSLTDGLDQAVRMRGYAHDILSRSAAVTGSDELGVRLELKLPSGARGHYAFALGVRSLGGYEVRREECVVTSPEVSAAAAHYVVEGGGAITTWEGLSLDTDIAPARVHDRLYLVNASGLGEFRSVYDALSRMAFYNLNPSRMREPQAPDAGERLAPDGANVASVLRRMHEVDPATELRVVEYLAHITPGIRRVGTPRIGRRETVEFGQKVGRDLWRFQADQVSEGTLRALGILVALFQARMGEEPSVSLVGIEEPENALHPAGAGVLLDALMDASETTQVAVTSHSADLLDRDDVDPESLLAVAAEHGVTRIGPVDRVGRTALREHLYTAGDLLRMNQITPVSDSSDGLEGGSRTVEAPAGR